MKALYSVIGLLLVVFLISSCTKPKPSSDFWGTADIEAQVLETSFPNDNRLVLKVLEINNYLLDSAPEQSLFEGDEITIQILDVEQVSQDICTSIEPSPGAINWFEKFKNLPDDRPKLPMQPEPGGYVDANGICNINKTTGDLECIRCRNDESIGLYEGSNAADLRPGDIINIEVRRMVILSFGCIEGHGGSKCERSYENSRWGLAQDSTISLVK